MAEHDWKRVGDVWKCKRCGAYQGDRHGCLPKEFPSRFPRGSLGWVLDQESGEFYANRKRGE